MPPESTPLSYTAEAVETLLCDMGKLDQTVLLVEGNDSKFWNRIKASSVRTLPCKGKKALKKGFRKALSEIPSLARNKVGIYDEDYEQYSQSESYEHPNLFSTKRITDLETLLVVALQKSDQTLLVGRGYYPPPQPIPKGVLEQALEICRKIGILRAKNEEESWGLKFKEDGPDRVQTWLRKCVDNHNKKDWELEYLIPLIIKNSPKSNIEEKKIADSYLKAVNFYSKEETYSLTNGHDICSTIEVLTNGVFRAKDIENKLQTEVQIANPNEFEIFRRIEDWSSEKKLPVLS